jgi:hypothetical protein
MRSVVLTASLLTTLWLGLPATVSAQEPEPAPSPAPEAPPPPPPARSNSVPRAERSPARESQARTPESRPTEERVRDSRPSENRIPVRAVERVREAAAESRARGAAAESRAREASNATSTSAATASDEQGAQRRGASRRPPSDRGSAGGAQTRDRAVPRTSAPRSEPDRVYVYPNRWNYNRYYYDPYYDNGFGLGYLYYSPWGWTPSFYGSPYGYGGGGYQGRYIARGYDIGAVKLKVDQRDAEVLVDGYFAGYVDDFDGFLQSLKLDSGAYRIEIRKGGFQTLHFDVRVQPDRTITFRGEMKAAP